MFKVKDRNTNLVYVVLDTKYDEVFKELYFLMWHKKKWCWKNANQFIPPNEEL